MQFIDLINSVNACIIGKELRGQAIWIGSLEKIIVVKM
jgi:hypothetical protein